MFSVFSTSRDRDPPNVFSNSFVDSKVSMNGAYDYKVKLVGILPQGYAYGSNPQRWSVKELKTIPVPSKHTRYIGTLENKDHPNLKGTGLIEKLSKIQPKPSGRTDEKTRQSPKHKIDYPDESATSGGDTDSESNWTTDSEASEDSDTATECENESSRNSSDSEDDSSSIDADEDSVSQSSSTSPSIDSSISSFKLCQLDEWNRGSVKLRWLKNNFSSETDDLPNILCSRRLLNQFMTYGNKFYTIKAKRTTFSSRIDSRKGRYSVIEITNGYSYQNLKDTYQQMKPTGESDFQQQCRVPNGDKNIAFYLATLNRIGSGSGDARPQKINVFLDAHIDGVWKQYTDPQDTKCEDVAEIRHIPLSNINPAPWQGYPHHYKQTILAGHWGQSMLVGADKYRVDMYDDETTPGVQTDKPPKEMWLYDVQNIPEIIKPAAKKDGFKAWDKREMLEILYNNVQYINNYMKKMSEEETIHFVHYENVRHLLPLNIDDIDDEMNCLREANKIIVMQNIRFDSPEWEIAEKNARSFIDNTMSHIPGSDRWSKPKILMFHEQQKVHVKFKYVQHANIFKRTVRKFIKSRSTPQFRSVKIQHQFTDRLQNLLDAKSFYDDNRGEDRNVYHKCYPQRFDQPNLQEIYKPFGNSPFADLTWSFSDYTAQNTTKSSNTFSNAASDLNWRVTRPNPIMPDIPNFSSIR